jgi:hypothetical protein
MLTVLNLPRRPGGTSGEMRPDHRVVCHFTLLAQFLQCLVDFCQVTTIGSKLRAEPFEPFPPEVRMRFLDAREHVVECFDAAAILGRAGTFSCDA